MNSTHAYSHLSPLRRELHLEPRETGTCLPIEPNVAALAHFSLVLDVGGRVGRVRRGVPCVREALLRPLEQWQQQQWKSTARPVVVDRSLPACTTRIIRLPCACAAHGDGLEGPWCRTAGVGCACAWSHDDVGKYNSDTSYENSEGYEDGTNTARATLVLLQTFHAQEALPALASCDLLPVHLPSSVRKMVQQ